MVIESWKVVDTGLDSPQAIMEKDRIFLEKMGLEKSPILHFYEWNTSSITYGYFLDPKKFFSFEGLEKEGISIARRPTGGGIIFHLWDFAFSALIPASHVAFSQNTLENYAYINSAVLLAAQEFLKEKTGFELTPQDGALLGKGCEYFCMAKPTKYDVMLHGKKIAGAAQRKTREGLLHQGSLSLLMPSQKILDTVLLPGFSVSEAMSTFTFPLLGEEESPLRLKKAREQIKELLKKHLTNN